MIRNIIPSNKFPLSSFRITCEMSCPNLSLYSANKAFNSAKDLTHRIRMNSECSTSILALDKSCNFCAFCFTDSIS